MQIQSKVLFTLHPSNNIIPKYPSQCLHQNATVTYKTIYYVSSTNRNKAQI